MLIEFSDEDIQALRHAGALIERIFSGAGGENIGPNLKTFKKLAKLSEEERTAATIREMSNTLGPNFLKYTDLK